MGRLVCSFADGSKLEYDQGAFDAWCVYLTRPNVERYAPRDFQYFERLERYGRLYGASSIYDDFVSVYDRTTKSLSNSVFEYIKQLTQKYGDDALDIAIDFSIIYMGMVAEENKAFTKLGKRVKRLGVYQVLIDRMNPHTAANFSRGKKWREIADICEAKGF